MAVIYAVQRLNRLGTYTRFELSDTNLPDLLTGTIAASSASRTVTGTGTAFLSEIEVGQFLYSENEGFVGRVESIESNTSLTLVSNAPLTISLEPPYVADVLPLVTDGKIQWELSRNGFGYLNTTMQGSIVDDDSKSFETLFYTDFFQEIGLRVFVGTAQYFYGVADLQQVYSRSFDAGRNQIDLTFYSRSAYKKTNLYYSDENQSDLLTFPSDEAPLFHLRFARVMKDFLFDYSGGATDEIVFSHRWRQEFEPFNNTTRNIQPYQLLNEMWFNAFDVAGDTAFDPNASIDDVMMAISRAFFFRFGWSVTEQLNMVINVDAGVTGIYNNDYTGSIITYTGNVGTADVYAITRLSVAMNVLQRLKFVNGVISRPTMPFGSVRYTREGIDHSLDREATFLRLNPSITERNFLQAYSFATIPFDPNATSGSAELLVLGGNTPDVIFEQPLGFFDDTINPSTAYDTPELNARVHMRFLESVRTGLSGTYIDLLDPLIPYATDFNGFFYNLVKGSWNVLDITTDVTESVSFSGTLDMAIRYIGGAEIKDLDSADLALRALVAGRHTADTVIHLLPGFDSTTSGSDELVDTWYGLNGVNGTSTGTSRPIQTGLGADFDGSNDFIEIPHNSNQLLTTGGTVMAWIRPDTIPATTTFTNNARIIDKTSGSGAADGFQMGVYGSDRLAFRINAGGSRFVSGVLTTGVWQHVAVVFDASGVPTFYVNGVSVGTTLATGVASGITTTNAIRLGNRSTVTSVPFDGRIALPLVTSQQFTASQMLAYYNSTKDLPL